MWKKLGRLGNVGQSVGYLLFGAFVVLFVFGLLTAILNNDRYEQEDENNVWLELKQPSDSEVINKLYDFYLDGQLTFEEKVQFINESGSRSIEHYLDIYLSKPENFKLILEGKMDHEEMLVEIDYSKKWMEDVLDVIFWIFLILLILFMTIWTIYWVSRFYLRIRRKN